MNFFLTDAALIWVKYITLGEASKQHFPCGALYYAAQPGWLCECD